MRLVVDGNSHNGLGKSVVLGSSICIGNGITSHVYIHEHNVGRSVQNLLRTVVFLVGRRCRINCIVIGNIRIVRIQEWFLTILNNVLVNFGCSSTGIVIL